MAAIALGAGIAGFLTSTIRLEVGPGAVQKSRLRSRTYDGAELALDTRGDVFVLRRRAKESGVVCAFTDADAERVRDVFTGAGVEIVGPPDVAPEAPAEDTEAAGTAQS